MAQDYTNYLAATVLSEGSIVTYRSLARVLKVNSNVAKRMLYDFHSKQTSRKPGSVHATYLVSGEQVVKSTTDGVHEADEDTQMQSSSLMSSSMPNQDVEEPSPLMKVITLTREEHLEAVKAKYANISSIHVYSLESSSLQNLQVLSDIKREVAATYAHEDLLVVAQQYGTITNPHVKRRTGPRPVVPVAAVSTPNAETKAATKGSSPHAAVKPSAAGSASQPQAKVKVKQEHSKVSSQKPAMKRELSDIFKAFGKPKPKLVRGDTASSNDAASGAETPKSEAANIPADELMKDTSEDEQEDDVLALSKRGPGKRKSKSEREEALRKIMDDEDDEMEDAPSPAVVEAEPASPSAPASQEALPSQENPNEPSVVVSGRRRRGKRQVMRKMTVKDDEGFLVTKEEPHWESFSEDEPPPLAKPNRTPTSTASSSTAKKSAAKPGKGNIMSFFGKKLH